MGVITKQKLKWHRCQEFKGSFWFSVNEKDILEARFQRSIRSYVPLWVSWPMYTSSGISAVLAWTIGTDIFRNCRVFILFLACEGEDNMLEKTKWVLVEFYQKIEMLHSWRDYCNYWFLTRLKDDENPLTYLVCPKSSQHFALHLSVFISLSWSIFWVEPWLKAFEQVEWSTAVKK